MCTRSVPIKMRSARGKRRDHLVPITNPRRPHPTRRAPLPFPLPVMHPVSSRSEYFVCRMTAHAKDFIIINAKKDRFDLQKFQAACGKCICEMLVWG